MLFDAVPVAASGYQDRINPMHALPGADKDGATIQYACFPSHS
jgi:hypothetical protein